MAGVLPGACARQAGRKSRKGLSCSGRRRPSSHLESSRASLLDSCTIPLASLSGNHDATWPDGRPGCCHQLLSHLGSRTVGSWARDAAGREPDRVMHCTLHLCKHGWGLESQPYSPMLSICRCRRRTPINPHRSLPASAVAGPDVTMLNECDDC